MRASERFCNLLFVDTSLEKSIAAPIIATKANSDTENIIATLPLISALYFLKIIALPHKTHNLLLETHLFFNDVCS